MEPEVLVELEVPVEPVELKVETEIRVIYVHRHAVAHPGRVMVGQAALQVAVQELRVGLAHPRRVVVLVGQGVAVLERQMTDRLVQPPLQIALDLWGGLEEIRGGVMVVLLLVPVLHPVLYQHR